LNPPLYVETLEFETQFVRLETRGLPISALIKIAIASLLFAVVIGCSFAGARAEELFSTGGDALIGPQRHGGGFEFRRRFSTIDNPYCDITTYVLPEFPEQASSTVDVNNNPVIVIDASILRQNLAHFLMAHECCHHILGHVRLTSERLGQLGPQPFYYVRPLLRTMELDADSCVVKMLKETKESGAIESAREEMLQFGNSPTGAETGVERADNIARARDGE
jgi:hypothetical protein